MSVSVLHSPQREGDFRREFAQLGHVAIGGAFAPETATAAVIELEGLAKSYERCPTGEHKLSITGFAGSGERPAATRLLQEIGALAAKLGRALWPLEQPAVSIIDLIRMEPGMRGSAHRDVPSLIDIVAITTLEGRSRLIFEGGFQYDLEPGVVVYHDPGLQLLHQGVASSQGERVGLVVAKE